MKFTTLLLPLTVIFMITPGLSFRITYPRHHHHRVEIIDPGLVLNLTDPGLTLNLTDPGLALNLTEVQEEPLLAEHHLHAKRETTDCKGSGLCRLVNKKSCLKAMEDGYSDTVTYYSETRRAIKNYYLPFTDGYCLGMFKCDNPEDYKLGKTGAELKQQ
ncbi:hypothetical protein AA313_de0209197 [Arthrobotrys entomopaga]|nr:hypothetical protein AA313_de0209197 [Arthrobotrys entomopaga]